VRIAAFLRATHWTLPAAALAAAGLAAAPAGAHDTWKEPGSVYLRAGVNAEQVNLPEVKAPIDNLTESIGHTDDTFWMEGLHAVVGFLDGSGMTLPDPIGQNARIEARLTYLRGDSESSARPAPGLGVGFVPADVPTDGRDGSLLADLALFKTDLETWQADLLYQTDVPLASRLVFSPLAGLTYTHLDLDDRFDAEAAGAPTGFSMRDEVSANYYGLALGAELVARPWDCLELRLGVRGDLMGADADLDVDQRFGALERDESDGDADFAGRGTASLGITLRIRRVELGVEGYGRYLSYMPTPEHPLSDGAFRSADSPSRIDDQDVWGVGWKARVGFWF
jgi:hypothetical protein